MIRTVEILDNRMILIESDAGKMLDIGCGPVPRMIANPAELEYVTEVEPEETPEEVG